MNQDALSEPRALASGGAPQPPIPHVSPIPRAHRHIDTEARLSELIREGYERLPIEPGEFPTGSPPPFDDDISDWDAPFAGWPQRTETPDQ